jgi:hypothetical protein
MSYILLLFYSETLAFSRHRLSNTRHFSVETVDTNNQKDENNAYLKTASILAQPIRPPRLSPIWIGKPKRAVFNWPWSVPDRNIVTFDMKKKVRDFSLLIPGKGSTYIYGHNETLYHQQYAESLYAFTMRKAGWDCMRHYEILGAGTVPYFLGLDHMPPNTMSLFPREIVKALISLPGVTVNYTYPNETETYKSFEVNSAIIDKEKFPLDIYNTLATSLNQYTKQYMTSSAVFRAAFLAATGMTEIKSALFIRNLTIEQGNRADYHEMLAILGMKFLLGSHGIDFPVLELLYEDYPPDKGCGWGGCFSYGRRLKREWKPHGNLSVADISSMIRQKKFDVIIYGEIARWPRMNTCMFAEDIAAAKYEANRIWLLRGADSFAKLTDSYPPGGTKNDHLGEEFSKAGRCVFYREV